MSILKSGRHAAVVRPSGAVISGEHLNGYPYPAGVIEGPGGEITGHLCLGTVGSDEEFMYRATDTEALTRLIWSAVVLRRQMTRACKRTARSTAPGGAA